MRTQALYELSPADEVQHTIEEALSEIAEDLNLAV